MALTHVTIVDPVTGRTTPDRTVLIANRRIRRIGASDSIRIPDGAMVRDAAHQYVIPGLWDMHVHTRLDGGAWALSEYVSHGITAVRDMGTQFEAVDSLRRAIADGRIVGPRIFAVGPMIENAAAMRGILANVTHEDSSSRTATACSSPIQPRRHGRSTRLLVSAST